MRVVGRYINLDASTARRAAMEAQLEQFGCADVYTRFRAVDGASVKAPGSRLSQGELGCFMSHYHCMVETAPSDHHVHIIEDDVVMAPQTPILLREIQDSLTDSFDLLYTDIFVPLNMSSIFNLMEFYRTTGMVEARHAPPSRRMPRSITYPNLKGIEFTGATSYVVNHNSRHKIRRLLDEALVRGPDQPIDMLLRRLVADGRLTALCTMPFLTSIQPDSIRDSTIAGRVQDPATAFAYYLMRSYFFVGKDDAGLTEQAAALSKGLADPGYMDTILEVFRFLFSDRFVQF